MQSKNRAQFGGGSVLVVVVVVLVVGDIRPPCEVYTKSRGFVCVCFCLLFRFCLHFSETLCSRVIFICLSVYVCWFVRVVVCLVVFFCLLAHIEYFL